MAQSGKTVLVLNRLSFVALFRYTDNDHAMKYMLKDFIKSCCKDLEELTIENMQYPVRQILSSDDGTQERTRRWNLDRFARFAHLISGVSQTYRRWITGMLTCLLV